MDKAEGIIIFRDTMEYLVNGLITAEQYAQLTVMIYNTRWNGVDYKDEEIEDKMVLLIWKTLKHSVKKSAVNARHYEKRMANRDLQPNTQFEAEISPIEAIKEEEPQVIPPMVPEAPEEPQNNQEKEDYQFMDTSNFDDKTWYIYESNEGALKTSYLRLKEHTDESERNEAREELRSLIGMYDFADKQEYNSVKTNINQLLKEWYTQVHNAQVA